MTKIKSLIKNKKNKGIFNKKKKFINLKIELIIIIKIFKMILKFSKLKIFFSFKK